MSKIVMEAQALEAHEHYQPQIDMLIAEVNEKAARIAHLEAQLRNPEREPPHCPSCSCGLAAQPIYPDPDPIDVAPPCDISETPPHLRGPIIQAHADTNGVPPQSETGEKHGD